MSLRPYNGAVNIRLRFLVPVFDARDTLPVQIFGTGFLVQPRVVITARHVMDGLTQTGFGKVGKAIPFEEVAFVFVDYPAPDRCLVQLTRGIGGFIVATEEPDLASRSPGADYAWVQLPNALQSEPLVEPPIGIPILEPHAVHVGLPVIVPSYYLTGR